MKSEQEKEVNKVIKEIEEETKDIIQNYLIKRFINSKC